MAKKDERIKIQNLWATPVKIPKSDEAIERDPSAENYYVIKSCAGRYFYRKDVDMVEVCTLEYEDAIAWIFTRQVPRKKTKKRRPKKKVEIEEIDRFELMEIKE